MAGVKETLLSFNRGLISPLALARSDFKRTALSAETMTNWMPRALGSMMLRPGQKYTGATKSNNACVQIPFIYSTDDMARVELTDSVMRVWVDDALVTRAAVTSAVANGAFTSNLTSWTDADEGSASSVWATGGYMSLTGTGNAAARRRQEVTTVETNTRHALTVVVERGPVKFKVGSSSGTDDYVSETTLDTGYHSLAFTPTGNFWVEFFNYNSYAALVDSVAVASAGVMEVMAPWVAADLSKIRWDQSGDILFVACDGYRQRKIERRATDSWSVVVYQSDNGPFQIQNTGPLTITPSATSGDITLTASAALFKSTQVGTLFRLTQSGQSASVSVTAENQFSSSIRVTGTGAQRAFSVIITGTWSATVTLQQSTDNATWVDATSGTYVANTAISYNDTLDNQIIYYRIGVKTGGYTSGTVVASLTYNSGSQTGIARVTSFTSSTVVNAQVLEAFAKTSATTEWSESYWSARRGFPTAVSFYEGRLWWAGRDRVWGSVSDSFYNHDDETEGDSGPISRSIGSGPVARINWLLPAQRLLLGADGAIWSARSSSLDEPLTPTNFNLKDISGQGASTVSGVKMDTNIAFVQRSGTRIYEAAYDGSAYDYAVSELTTHYPEAGEPSIVKTVVQRQPETRLHHIRSDGSVVIEIFYKAEEINCFVTFETDGDVEDAVVLPGDVEDQVYYTVKRTINGSTVRYHEKWALESECVGGTLNKQADSFLSGSGSGASITGLTHLEGETVVCWADGKDKGTFTVSGGAISQAYTTGYVVGLPYTAQFKSTKLLYSIGQASGLGLLEKKRINAIAILAKDMHYQGLEYGPDFSTLDELPLAEGYSDTAADTIWSTYDEDSFTFPGNWDTDSRLCLQAAAPRPVTLLACVVSMEASGK